jgi:hypothetical protein
MELAAAEPGGLERLMAGDTPDGMVVAGHLSGCPACIGELGRLRRSATILREVIGGAPDPALRGRTLAYIRANGVARGPVQAANGSPAPAAVADRAVAPSGSALPAPVLDVATPHRSGPALSGRRIVAGWIAGVAAAAVFAAGLTAALIVPSRDARIASQQEEIAVLARVSAWTVRLEGQADATRVALAGAGGEAAGSLVYSPSSGDLVVLAAGLEAPAVGREYGCWLEEGGAYRWIGRMRFGGDVAGWAGPVEGLDALADDAVFRVSLDKIGGQAPDAPVLWGRPSLP